MYTLKTERQLLEIFKGTNETLSILRNTKNALNIVRKNIGNFSFAANFERYFEIYYMEEFIGGAIAELEEGLTTAEKLINKLPGTKAKVLYMRDIELKPLQDIADELGYSIGYIQNLSARLPKIEAGS